MVQLPSTPPLVVLSLSKRLVAVNAHTGQRVWEHEAPGGAGGRLFVEQGLVNARGISVLKLSVPAPTTTQGYFTQAFLDTLADPHADHNADAWVQTSELVDEVTRRVGQQTNGLQTPWIARRELLGDFSLLKTSP